MRLLSNQHYSKNWAPRKTITLKKIVVFLLLISAPTCYRYLNVNFSLHPIQLYQTAKASYNKPICYNNYLQIVQAR